MAEERSSQDIDTSAPAGSLREVAAVFLKLGTIAFGGPAAHIALMRQEVVERRRWISEQRFLDLLGASNVIPGPTSTELAIYLGYARAGRRGLLLAGALFILPAVLIVLAFAWAYGRFGSTSKAQWVLYGIKPVIIAIILVALWGLARTAVRDLISALVAIAVAVLVVLGVNPLALLVGAGLIILAIRERALLGRLRRAALLPAPLAATGAGHSLLTLFLTFLKIGAVVWGSGYVLLAFLRTDFVQHLHWLTDRQLVDAVAVGQLTPGPVFTTATFIGYLVGGVPGALLATLAIFLPSFVFVALLYPLVPRIRQSPVASTVLDGVNVAAIGLIAGVTWELARAAIVDPFTAALTVASLVILLRLRPNSAWLIAAGAVLGLAYHFLTVTL
jgi:chromate transporter